MKSACQFKNEIPPLLSGLALVCFALLPSVQAVVPPPDGGYPGANTAEGDNALLHVNTAIGINNTAVGANALRDDTTGYYNVAVGSGALANNTTGNFNMAIGTEALTNNNANFNLAIGFRVGYLNTTGNHLTGIGAAALRNNTTGSENTAIGADAMRENTTGSQNTAVGTDALVHNDTGFENTAFGFQALSFNTTGFLNTAVGYQVLSSNTTGQQNTAIGFQALNSNDTGGFNTAIGEHALQNNTTGGANTALGYLAGTTVTTAHNVICIGDGGQNVNSTTWISNIYGVTTQSGVTLPVIVSQNRQLGTMSSSRRFKKEIKPMDKASEAILALNPVTFQYKSDKTTTPQFGLVAEDVAEVTPDLVVRDDNGDIYAVRYDAVNAMLLNEFLKEHKAFVEEQKKVEKLEAALAAVTKRLNEQEAKIERVSAQMDIPKTTAQMVSNNP
jgi:trimeric autotransporter adhesin